MVTSIKKDDPSARSPVRPDAGDVQTPAAVSADGDVPVRVPVTLPPTSLRVRRGERFRLVVAGGAFPRFARSPGTGESPATATTFRTARIDVHHDAEHPSSLTLPHMKTS
jgi:uncharacterized protein